MNNPTGLEKTLSELPANTIIFDSFVKANSLVTSGKFKRIVVSVSGGSDSDLIVDIISKVSPNAEYVYFDTGLEYQATKCYTEYALKRTGCAGCPFGRDFEFELDVLEKYEPKLYKAVCNIFKDSYEYTRKYREYRKLRENNEKQLQVGYQTSIFDYLSDES